MLFEDYYFTIEQPTEGLYKEKGSKFLAYAFPIVTEQDAKIGIEQIKKEHPKARHWCWAYRLTLDRTVFRINDDGEPSGTAGKPILNVLLSKNITYTLVVVVRYFGGTLLGVPGLIAAYKGATQDALDNASVQQKYLREVHLLQFDYAQISLVLKHIQSFDAKILEQDFQTLSSLTLSVRKSHAMPVLDGLFKNGVHSQYVRDEI